MRTHLSDMFWYIVIGLVTVLAIWFSVLYVPERYSTDRSWVVFLLFSFFLFAYLVKMYWRLRRSVRFWVLMLMLTVGHVLMYAPLLKYVQRVSWYLVIMPIEGMLIVLIIKLVLNVMPDLTVRL